jgi:hypothetical protein
MYRSLTIKEIEHIFCDLPDGGVQSFPNLESNNGPERLAYLAWLEEGNVPEEWNPEAPQ